MSIVAHTLKQQGHTPLVVLSEEGPLVQYLQNLHIPVRIIRLGVLRRKYMNIPGLFNRISVSRKAWKELSRLIKEQDIQVIYSNTTSVLIGAPLAKKHKIRHVWHIHEIITKPLWFSRILGFLIKKYGDQVIGVSEAVKTHWEQHTAPKKVLRIYNGIDVKPFFIQSNALKEELNLPCEVPLVGMIGRVNHWKGQDYFLEIIQFVHRMAPEVHFVLVGDAYPGNEHLETELNERIASLEMAASIHNLGYREDIPQLLQGLDVFLSPSTLPDPFPTVILEAMASAKPVVATAHGGAVEMIENGVTGALIPVNDAKKAAEILVPFLLDKEKREAAGRLARNRILESYSLESFQKNIGALFNSLKA